MKLVTAALAALVLLSTTGLEAWPWSGKRKLPKAVDTPIVRPKVQDTHKAGKRNGRHSAAVQRHGWGLEKGVYKSKRVPQLPSYLFQE